MEYEFKVGDKVKLPDWDTAYPIAHIREDSISLGGFYYPIRLGFIKESVKTPHKHAELIKAWADGEKIQGKAWQGKWFDTSRPDWLEENEYRIKPEPKPDNICFGFCPGLHDQDSYPRITNIAMATDETDNIKFTFDGETGKLKSVEMIGE